MQKGNLYILFLCQTISATGSFTMVTLAGVIGSRLTPVAGLATLPVSMVVIATAVTAIPATIVMRRIGRSRGFSIASLSAAVALVCAGFAIAQSSFALLVLAGSLFGINMAFTQQYRYAAAESVPSKYVARTVSLVLLGSIGGALIGPELVNRGEDWVAGVPYAGTMAVVASMYVIQSLLFTQLKGLKHRSDGPDIARSRPLREIAKQPVYLAAVLGGTVGYGVMAFIMTATPLSMHVLDGFSMEQTSTVISRHVIAMYAPSLVSGFLIERFGVVRLMFTGALLILVTSTIGLQGHEYVHYWWALVLLGVGWNFLYVGGTTMLTYSYSIEERFRAQAVNEFLVFGMSATASLLAGVVIQYFGWFRLMLIPLPILIFTCVALVLVRRDPLLSHRASTT